MEGTARKSAPHPLLERLSRGPLSEPVLGFCSIVALALALAPFVFDLSPGAEWTLDTLEGAIVALFALEYGVGLALAPRRLAYVFSAWRLVDLFIILGPSATFLLRAGELRAVPALRILRVVLFSARLGGTVSRHAPALAPLEEKGPARVSMLSGSGPPRATTWDEVTRGLASAPSEDWYHASGLDRDHVAQIAREAGISPSFLSQTLAETAYPRVEVYDRFSALFTWIPSLGPGDDSTVERNGVLLLATDRGILTVAQRGIDLQDEVVAILEDAPLRDSPFATRTSLGILKCVLRHYEEVAGHLEHHVRALELLPVRESRPDFLGRTFRIQRQLSALKSDLWRLKGILGAITDGRLPFHGIAKATRPADDASDEHDRASAEYLRVLTDEASYVYETVFNAREGLLSLIDLHLNVVSFEMNKVMRVLAVVSGLGLVPTVVGGLLGMNVAGNPWPVSLAQVSFGVATAMVLSFYVFLVKGWLR